ncbi:MAG: VRR-NUC domain-containing protein [Candidatus Thiodiazotropha taylori]|uniref:VRR-NUC domain-containing protein n=1 Tax=Candidatus Thiodiazotropha taylori TaxID=2792791 RepID=A0A9E4N5S9_9GAMM|nr:VRR-NUC domain-containing protein [Candidatus Thiodiazotropha taylori]MCW4258182.1 VRR-NUC domain-containing protein [Candidatus Thiodiazotropha taylori]
MRERDVEKYLREEIQKLGGECLKWVSPGRSGVPDRIIMVPGDKARFVEVKPPGGKPTTLQKRMHRRLITLGQHVAIVDSKEAVDEYVAELIA